MKIIRRFVFSFLVVLLTGCSGINLPFGAQSGEPGPKLLYCEYALAHDVIQFTPDGKYLLSGNCLWSMAEPIRERPLVNLNSKPVEKKNEIINNLSINSFRFYPSPVSNYVAVVDMNGGIRLLSLADRKLSELAEAGHSNAVVFAPDGRMLTRAGTAINLWSPDLSKPQYRPLIGENGPVEADNLLVSPDGKMLAAWNGANLSLFDLTSDGAFLRTIAPEANQAIVTAVFSPDSQSLAVARVGGQVVIYTAASGEARSEISFDDGAEVDKVIFSPDSTQLAASSSKQHFLGVWQAADGGVVQLIQMPMDTKGSIYHWAVLPDGQLFVIFSDGLVSAWSLVDGKLIYSGNKADVAARSIAVWPDNSTYAVFKGNLTIYRAADNSQLSIQNVLESQVWKNATGVSSGDVDVESIAVSPDLKYIAIQLFNQSAILWPIE